MVHLCLINDDALTPDAEGILLTKPPYYFFASTKDCKLKLPLLLYPFHLCLIPFNQSVKITIKRGKEYHDLTLTS